MAIIKRYPLSSEALEELKADLQRLFTNLPELSAEIADEAGQKAETHFSSHLSTATGGRQAAITTELTTEKHGKYGRTARLTATGKTESTGFNILMAVEFGAGIAGIKGFSNTSFEMGMGSGTWPGQTHAYNAKGWLYYKDGEFHRTLGTPATMPMHLTILDMKQELKLIAAEAFRRWLNN